MESAIHPKLYEFLILALTLLIQSSGKMRVAKRRYFFKGNQNGYISHLEEYVANLAKYAGDLESLVDKANIQWKRLPLVAEIQEQDTANSREVLTPQEGSQGHREGGSFTFQLVNKPQDRLTPTNSFLSRLPKNEEEWSQKRINVQFATSEQMAQLFDLLTRRSGQISFPDIGSKPDFGANFGQIAKDYSKLVRAMRVKSELSTQLKHYSHLVFNCICVVVLELGMPLDEVDQLSRDFVDNSGQSSRYMSRLRAASKWIAQHSESLESSLQHRAPELFFMCKTPFTIKYTATNNHKGVSPCLNTVPSLSVLGTGSFSCLKPRKYPKLSRKLQKTKRVSPSRQHFCSLPWDLGKLGGQLHNRVTLI